MKIVEFIPQLSSGGAERFVVDLANELSKQHTVYLLVSYPLDYNHNFYSSELSSRIKIYSLNKKKGADLIYLIRVYKVLRAIAPDVVHTHVESFMHVALLRWMLPKFVFIHTIHNDALYESGGKVKAFFKRLFFQKGWCKAVTISRASDNSFKDFYHAPSTLIYNGRAPFIERESPGDSLTLIPAKESGYNFISIGHISKTKNHMLLCQAVSNLVKEGAQIDLYMFGRFASAEIVDKIKSLECPNIHLLGEVSNPRLYLGHADVFCMSSIMEGMPISLIEAMSCGLIPICTPVGGIVDMIKDGYNGFLSDDLSLDSYARALRRFLNLNEEERTKIKKNVIESSYLYTIEHCATQYVLLFCGGHR